MHFKFFYILLYFQKKIDILTYRYVIMKQERIPNDREVHPASSTNKQKKEIVSS